MKTQELGSRTEGKQEKRGENLEAGHEDEREWLAICGQHARGDKCLARLQDLEAPRERAEMMVEMIAQTSRQCAGMYVGMWVRIFVLLSVWTGTTELAGWMYFGRVTSREQNKHMLLCVSVSLYL